MEKAVYSVDFTKKIKKAKAAHGGSYDIACAHCGAMAAKLVHEKCGSDYGEPVKFNGVPEDKKKKEFRAGANRFNQDKGKPRDPHEYQRDLPKYFPEVNHSLDIVCPSCGNIAAKLYPVRDDMYAEGERS